MTSKQAALRNRAVALRDKVIALARDVEAEFGAQDDRTIFARNAYCELQEVANTIAKPEDKCPRAGCEGRSGLCETCPQR